MRSRSFDIDRIPKQTGALQNLKSLSLFIHARVFHQYRNIHLKKNLSPSFPGSFSVKVNTVYALVLSTMYKWSSLIPMVNYPTNEMSLTKIIRLDRNDLSNHDIPQTDASSRLGQIRNLFRIISMYIFAFSFLFIVKKRKKSY